MDGLELPKFTATPVSGYKVTSNYNSSRESIYLDNGVSVTRECTESIYIDEPVVGFEFALSEEPGESSEIEKARFKISKSTQDKQLVFGWANIAKDAEGNYPLDWDTDVTQPEELEAAAYTYVLKYRTTGEKHQGEAVGELVESVMLTKEKQQALGIPEGTVPEGWWVGFYIEDPEVFAKIKSGEYEMFSVQGSAQRVPTGQ